MSSPRVVVLDYGFGNVRSAVRALEHVGAEVTLTADAAAARAAAGLVVPGVGAFASCVAGLRSIGGDTVIADRVAADAPVLGICVGMQVLFDSGVEHGTDAVGLGLLPGVVAALDARPLPHMGWNTVAAPPGSPLFARVAGERFYFVHSYAVRTPVPAPEPAPVPTHSAPVPTHSVPVPTRSAPDGLSVTTAEHGGDTFWAAVEAGPLSATQFHPEKSGEAGLGLLEGWVRRL